MDSECIVAAYILLSLKKDKDDRPVNTARCPFTLEIPWNGARYLNADKARIDHIMKEGEHPSIDWEKVHRQYRSTLEFVLGRRCTISFIEVSYTPKDSNLKQVDVDQLLLESGSDDVVFHRCDLVLIATFSEQCCEEIATMAENE
jgi:hypothetical protein